MYYRCSVKLVKIVCSSVLFVTVLCNAINDVGLYIVHLNTNNNIWVIFTLVWLQRVTVIYAMLHCLLDITLISKYTIYDGQ